MKRSAFHPFRSAQAKAEYQALYMKRAKAWPVASETRLIETPSGQTFVRTSGRPEDPPLILLPGSRGTSLTWVPNIAALSAQYRTYCLDSIYDVGLSVSYRSISQLEDVVTWLDEVLAALVPGRSPSLMGLSYGGWLASHYALRFPERLHKVVLLAPAMTVLRVPLALIIRASLTRLPPIYFRKQFYYWLLHDTVKSGAAGQAIVDEEVSDWAVAERCFGPLPRLVPRVMSDVDLQSFKVPCLFLVGEHEKIFSARQAAARLNRVAPQIRAQIIPRSGHDLWQVQAEIVNRKILDFLGEP